MSEEQDTAAEESGENEEHGPRGGERLAEARRAQQISVLEVAKELHLDEHKVRALERNDFDVLGAPVFAKGHLRKYAQLVGVDEDDVFADYYRLTRQDVAPPIIVGRRPRRSLRRPSSGEASMATAVSVAKSRVTTSGVAPRSRAWKGRIGQISATPSSQRKQIMPSFRTGMVAGQSSVRVIGRLPAGRRVIIGSGRTS